MAQQLYITGLDHTFNLSIHDFTLSSIQQSIYEYTSIPIEYQSIYHNGHLLHSSYAITTNDSFPTFLTLQLNGLKGGKGGFGSNLRAATTKVGAKKTTNFSVSEKSFDTI